MNTYRNDYEKQLNDIDDSTLPGERFLKGETDDNNLKLKLLKNAIRDFKYSNLNPIFLKQMIHLDTNIVYRLKRIHPLIRPVIWRQKRIRPLQFGKRGISGWMKTKNQKFLENPPDNEEYYVEYPKRNILNEKFSRYKITRIKLFYYMGLHV